MKYVGLVGWRGMVGSVLMDRMRAENDFALIDPVFFTTSNVGGQGPDVGQGSSPLKDARSIAELKALDVIVTCQGGDYTSEIYPQLRAAGWQGYWIDAASTLRMKDDAVIILDPVNRQVIEDALARGAKNFIGGNCTVSLMLMGLGGLFAQLPVREQERHGGSGEREPQRHHPRDRDAHEYPAATHDEWPQEAAEFVDNAGPAGWTAQQGFYVYRNARLLVAGGWLGLGNSRAWNREEAHRLARIQLDIPNTADADWKIDVRKSTARPPVSLRPWLIRLAEDTRERARRVFAYRGTPMPTQRSTPIEQAWRVDRVRDGIRYRIEQTHPAVAAVLDSAGDLAPLVKAMLRVIEESVPVQRIWLDTAENKDTPKTGFSGEPPEAVVTVLRTLFADMIGRRGMSVEVAKRSLLSTEPFQNYPGLIAGLGDPDTA